MPEGTARPLLSIGVPVYNGARHLRAALDSLLAQDERDLELVISDNASTDETPSICAEYVEKDSRVRYCRNEQNIGAAANFNRAFELCSGQFFMWGSDDDVWEPRFASNCIDALKRNAEAVLCTSFVQVIDDDGLPHPDERYEPMDTTGMDPAQRVRRLLERPLWYDMYSVFRPEALRRTGLYAPTFGGDVHLLLELALLGEFLVVPERLFNYRVPHLKKTPSDQASEIGADVRDRAQYARPWSFLASDLTKVIEQSGSEASAISRMTSDFVDILSRDGSFWGRAILLERGWVFVPPRWIARRDLRATMYPDRPESTWITITKRVWLLLIRLGVLVKGLGRRVVRHARRNQPVD